MDLDKLLRSQAAAIASMRDPKDCMGEVGTMGGKPKPGGKPDARLAGNSGGRQGKSQGTPGRKKSGTTWTVNGKGKGKKK